MQFVGCDIVGHSELRLAARMRFESQGGCDAPTASTSGPGWSGEEISLRRKRFVDRNWGPNGVAPMPPKRAASFDEVVENMGLSPAQYASSAELKEWVRANRGRRYVPIDLLIAWGFEVEPL